MTTRAKSWKYTERQSETTGGVEKHKEEKGAEGEKGEKGAEGEKGEKGEKGAEGEKGVAGEAAQAPGREVLRRKKEDPRHSFEKLHQH